MIFASDNWAGASPKIMDALAAAARGGGPAYGGDPLTRQVERQLAELFEHEVAVFLVATGTAANALALSAYARPGGVVLGHRHAHITVDEAGATSFFGGGVTVTGLDGEGVKFGPAALTTALHRMTSHVPHSGQPVAISMTEITELGVAYRPAEVAALAEIAHAHGLGVHMDGARFANAVAALGVSPADLTWRAGVDVLSFGGTKNGCLAAEALVFFNPEHARDVPFQRQRAGQGFSKNWVLAAQFAAYLDGGHWLELAGNANRMAARLAAAIRRSPQARLAIEPDGNELFVVLSKDADRRLKAAGAAYNPWSEEVIPAASRPGAGESLVRLIASWQTTEETVDRFAAILAQGS